ncbi:MAG: lectin like domain-containing protein [Eubacteriales bacterium]|nr:lectin like domain-containing protein [Eubacteriales bacterium]
MKYKLLRKRLSACFAMSLALILGSSSLVQAGTVYELFELVEGEASESGYIPVYDPAVQFELEDIPLEDTASGTSSDETLTDGEIQAYSNEIDPASAFSDDSFSDPSDGSSDIFQDDSSDAEAPGDIDVFSAEDSSDSDLTLFSDEPSDTSEVFYEVSAYSLLDEGCSTPVKNQASLNVCWAFSALESIETGLIKQNLASGSLDLSEAHLVYSTFHGQNDDPDDPTRGETYVPFSNGQTARWTQGSGNRLYSIATLARGYGVAYSKDYPLSLLFDADASDGAGNTTSILDGIINKKTSEGRLRNCYWLPEINYQATVNGPVSYRADKVRIVKQFIKNHGAVEIGIKATGSPNTYDAETNSFYSSEPYTPDHSVTLIGWDDSKVTKAEKPGAFLMQNSWGADKGENGYYWVSYYDRSLKSPAFYEMEDEPLGSQDNLIISQYDGTGYSSVIRPETPRDDLRISGANVFLSEQAQYLRQVSFYAAAFPLKYKISVYRYVDTSPDTGELVHTQTGTVNYSGYYTIDLTQAIPIAANEKFAVQLEFDHKNGYVPHERLTSDTGLRIYTADYGQSYLYDGEKWSDMMDLGYECNICIKGIGEATSDAITIAPSKPELATTKVSNGNRLTLSAKASSEKIDGYDYVLGTSPSFLKAKNYLSVKKQDATTSAVFSYLQKGTYYAAVHAYRLDKDGTKVFSPWSDVCVVKITGQTPGTPKFKTCKTGKGTLTATYCKASNAYRYEYVLATQKFSSTTFKPSSRLKTYTNRKYGSISLKNIPKGTYYFGIRAYTVQNGTKVYGKWAVKKISVK